MLSLSNFYRRTTPEGTPSEIYLKVTPEPIAFVMKFVDGKMMIEFKGSWAAFQVVSVFPSSYISPMIPIFYITKSQSH